jgi:hypothetical protein
VLYHLFDKRAIMANRDYPEAVILEFTAYALITRCSADGVVLWPIEEDADSGHSVALVEEIGLGRDIGGWARLRVAW